MCSCSYVVIATKYTCICLYLCVCVCVCKLANGCAVYGNMADVKEPCVFGGIHISTSAQLCFDFVGIVNTCSYVNTCTCTCFLYTMHVHVLVHVYCILYMCAYIQIYAAVWHWECGQPASSQLLVHDGGPSDQDVSVAENEVIGDRPVWQLWQCQPSCY